MLQFVSGFRQIYAGWAIFLFSVHFLVTHTYARTRTHTHTHPFNGPFSAITRVSQYQKGKTNLDFTEARVSEWQWHQLGGMHLIPDR